MMSLWGRLVRFGFRLLYHEMAFSYDWVSWWVSRGDWQRWQESAVRFLPSASEGQLLELAHGTGDLQITLKRAGYQTIAYDFSAQMGRITRAKLIKQSFVPVLVRGRGQELPFQAESFRAIVCTFPTDFIVHADTLSEVWRVLQPVGRLVIVLNGTLKRDVILSRFIEWLYRITGQREARLPDWQAHFAQFGFAVRFEEVTWERSTAQLFIAEKK